MTSNADVQAYIADTTIDGGTGNDIIFAGAGDDNVVGGLGQDAIVGWRGNDVLTGGLSGGTGDNQADLFYFSDQTGGGLDRITDWEDGLDTIWLIAYGVTSFQQATTNNILTWASDGTDTTVVLQGTQTNKIVLEGYTGPLDASDFGFLDTAPVTFAQPGPNFTPVTGTSASEQLTGTDNNDTFQVGAGADILEGKAGNDTFALSTTDIDGTWGSLFLQVSEVSLSDGTPITVGLNGRIQVNDTFLGGEDYDKILGTNQGEAIIIYDPVFSASNSLLSNFDARIVSVEEFDMGGGDDIVNLTASLERQGYATDAKLIGGAGSDNMFAGAGNDSVIGGTGTDYLIGWKGSDVLTGGDEGGNGDTETDYFIFSDDTSGGINRITDYEDGVDKLLLVGFGVSNLADATTTNVVDISTGTQDTTITLIGNGKTTEIIVEDFTGTLGSDDFLFYV